MQPHSSVRKSKRDIYGHNKNSALSNEAKRYPAHWLYYQELENINFPFNKYKNMRYVNEKQFQ